MIRRTSVATVLAVAIGLLSSASGASAQHDVTGQLEVRVILVGSDLSLKPVPKKRFRIVPESPDLEPTVVSTSFSGEITTSLPPGRYRIQTDTPVDLEGKLFYWDLAFEITTAVSTVLELSNDNAVIESGAPAVTDEGALYERFKDGVFKVVSDGRHGSGFLVSEDGLILTNHHIVVDAFYLAVKLDDRHKYEAVVLAEDPELDLALLRVHPETVRGRPVMQLAEDGPDQPAVTVGHKVLAIGSPLTTETILTSGLVSKVEEKAIYSDVSINPGNSGGPLFDSRGQVVGISTFGLQAESGPGVSGIARIYIARPLLEEGFEKLGDGEPPSARPLPVEPVYRFPPAVVRTMALAEARELSDYHIEQGKIDVHFLTPVLLASVVIQAEREALEGRKKRKKKKGQQDEEPYEPGEQFYEWQKDGENFRSVVRVRAYPEVNLSKALAGALVGKGKLRFKTDFERMELRRDGTVVEPIHPGRIKEVVSQPGFKDVGFWGYYEYPPDAFAPGAVLTLTLWEEDVPEPRAVGLPAELVGRIGRDLQPYFESLETEAPSN